MAEAGLSATGRMVIGLAIATGAVVPTSALAGPPYMTDDAEPPEPGHFEIYGPIFEIEGRGSEYGGGVGAEINFGAAPDLQLTLEVPLAYQHDATGTRWGRGDMVVAAKYRFYHNEESGLSLAVFPELGLPTSSNGLGSNKVGALLPVWFQKDSGPWTIFGGGGYAINPGAGNRDYWTGGLAATRALSDDLTIGVEASRQGPDAIDARASTSLGVGVVKDLAGPFRLLASVGPTIEDGGGAASYHLFIALGADF